MLISIVKQVPLEISPFYPRVALAVSLALENKKNQAELGMAFELKTRALFNNTGKASTALKMQVLARSLISVM